VLPPQSGFPYWVRRSDHWARASEPVFIDLGFASLQLNATFEPYLSELFYHPRSTASRFSLALLPLTTTRTMTEGWKELEREYPGIVHASLHDTGCDQEVYRLQHALRGSWSFLHNLRNCSRRTKRDTLPESLPPYDECYLDWVFLSKCVSASV